MSTIQVSSLPQTIPVFPLSGALLLPRGQLPLNIFEPRYLAMVDDALRSGDRLIGMIQPKEGADPPPLYDIGCAGKITTFQETGDGRYIIALRGICRFNVQEELETTRGYRRVSAEWSKFLSDKESSPCYGFKRAELFQALESYFEVNDLQIDWDVLEATPDEALIAALAMICPFTSAEKQALLEADSCQARGDLLQAMLEIAIHEKPSSDKDLTETI